jgi:hypothetical protein
MESIPKKLNFKGTTTSSSTSTTTAQPEVSLSSSASLSNITPEKRKDAPVSSGPKKRNENYYQLKEYLESDHGHAEEIDRKVVANLSFEALYEDSGKKNDRLAEVTKEDKTLNKTELDSMEHQIPEVERYLNIRNGDLTALKHKIPIAKTVRSKKQHVHLSVVIPSKPFKKNDESDELNHLRFLKQEDTTTISNDNNNNNNNSNVASISQLSDLMSQNRYDSIENYIENRLFRIMPSADQYADITFEQLIMEMRRFGGTDLFEFKFKGGSGDVIQFVFPVDDFDVFYCCIECKIVGSLPPVKIPDYFSNSPGKMFVWKELRILQMEKHINDAILIMQQLRLSLVQRYYFHCGCDLI